MKNYRQKIYLAFFFLVVLGFGCSNYNHVQQEFLKNNSYQLFEYFFSQDYSVDSTDNQIVKKNNLFSGTPYISNIKSKGLENNRTSAIIQDNENMMLFTNRKGVSTYDGTQWGLVKTFSTPNCFMKIPHSEKILLGCNNDFGFLEKNEKGIYTYSSLAEKLEQIGNISNIQLTDSAAYFYSSKSLNQVLLSDFENIKQWTANDATNFTGIVGVKNKIFVNLSGEGLHLLENETIKPFIYKDSLRLEGEVEPLLNDSIQVLLEEYDFLSEHKILFSIHFLENLSLFGTNRNELILFDGFNFFEYKSEVSDFLEDNVLLNAIELSDNQIVVSTLTGGSVIIEKQTGKIVSTINYQTGLPDDEIFAMGVDYSHGLWLAHEFGVSRVNTKLPVEVFNSYPGLQGKLFSVANFDSTMYVATSKGLFFLSEIKDYKEIEVLVQIPKKIEQEVIPTEIQPTINYRKKDSVVVKKEKITVKKEEKKGWFARWSEKRRKKREAKERQERLEREKREKQKKEKQVFEKNKKEGAERIEISNLKTDSISSQLIIAPPTVHKKKKKKSKFDYVSHKSYVVQSIGNMYRKLEGIDEKCKEIINFKNQLIVATNVGLYAVQKQKAELILANEYINAIALVENEDYLLTATMSGIYKLSLRDNKWQVAKLLGIDEPIYSVVKDEDFIWAGGENLLYKVETESLFNVVDIQKYNIENVEIEAVIVRKVNGKICLLQSGSTYIFDEKENKLKLSISFNSATKKQQVLTHDSLTWVKYDNKWAVMNQAGEYNYLSKLFFNMFDDIRNISVDSDKNLWVIDGNNKLYKILSAKQQLNFSENFDVFIQGVSNLSGLFFSLKKLELKFDDNSLNFSITAPFFVKENSTHYQYLVENFTKEWSEWTNNPTIKFAYIPPGDYVLKVRAKNIFDKISPEKEFSFRIKPPFYLSWWFALLVISAITGLVYWIVKLRERKLQREKHILEEKVKIRTAEIARQKEQITSSINYARHIQQAALPPEEIMATTLPEHFVFYKPRDIVSGDFYWLKREREKIVLAVADCTGHGVPGAFLSMLGISQLNDVVKRVKTLKANEILNSLRDNFIRILHQEKGDQTKDGMDISLCVFDFQNKRMQFAGAHNPIYIIRDGNLKTYDADRMPIGFAISKNQTFTNYEFELKKDDTIYMFTDGYLDQFGGDKKRKFMRTNFKKLLLSIYDKPMQKQQQLMETAFDKWKGENKQVDDVLVMGLRVS